MNKMLKKRAMSLSIIQPECLADPCELNGAPCWNNCLNVLSPCEPLYFFFKSHTRNKQNEHVENFTLSARKLECPPRPSGISIDAPSASLRTL